MGTLQVTNITDEAGTGAPDFPNGLTDGGQPLASGLTYVQHGASATLAHNTLNYVSDSAGSMTLTFPAITAGDVGKRIEIYKSRSDLNTVTLVIGSTPEEVGSYDSLRSAGGGVSAAGPFTDEFGIIYVAVDFDGAGDYRWMASVGFAY